MMELRLKLFLMCIFGTGCLVRKCISAVIYVFLFFRRRSSPLHHDTWHISSGWSPFWIYFFCPFPFWTLVFSRIPLCALFITCQNITVFLCKHEPKLWTNDFSIWRMYIRFKKKQQIQLVIFEEQNNLPILSF